MFQLVFEKMKVHILKVHRKLNSLKTTRKPFVYADVAIHVFPVIVKGGLVVEPCLGFVHSRRGRSRKQICSHKEGDASLDLNAAHER